MPLHQQASTEKLSQLLLLPLLWISYTCLSLETSQTGISGRSVTSVSFSSKNLLLDREEGIKHRKGFFPFGWLPFILPPVCTNRPLACPVPHLNQPLLHHTTTPLVSNSQGSTPQTSQAIKTLKPCSIPNPMTLGLRHQF